MSDSDIETFIHEVKIQLEAIIHALTEEEYDKYKLYFQAVYCLE